MNHGTGFLDCSCCGGMVANNAEENVYHGVEPYPSDKGYGMCRDCGGDPEASTDKAKMGWAMRCFVEARFNVVRSNLQPHNQNHWDGLTYTEKAGMVVTMVERGVIF